MDSKTTKFKIPRTPPRTPIGSLTVSEVRKEFERIAEQKDEMEAKIGDLTRMSVNAERKAEQALNSEHACIHKDTFDRLKIEVSRTVENFEKWDKTLSRLVSRSWFLIAAVSLAVIIAAFSLIISGYSFRNAENLKSVYSEQNKVLNRIENKLDDKNKTSDYKNIVDAFKKVLSENETQQ